VCGKESQPLRREKWKLAQKGSARRAHKALAQRESMAGFGGGAWGQQAGLQGGQQDAPLPNPMADSVQCISWSPTANYLVAGAWDGTVRLWQVSAQGQGQFGYDKKHAAPVLDVCWNADGSRFFSASCDKSFKMVDVQSQAEQSIPNAHDAPIKGIRWCPLLGGGQGALCTAGWDNKLNFWDLRQQRPAATLNLSHKPYSMDVSGGLLVVGTADKNLFIYNVGGQAPMEHKKAPSILKFQTRCVTCFPDGDGFAVGSIEGRVAIQYVEPIAHNKAKEDFSFKCHRDDKANLIYAVNDIAFNTKHKTFATVGSDGKYVFWDKDSRSRLKPAADVQAPSQITSCSFNGDASMFAYAQSYDWSQGHQHYQKQQPNNILIHCTPDSEIKKKGAKTSTFKKY